MPKYTTEKDYSLKNAKGFKLTQAQNEIVEALLRNDYFYNCAQTGIGKTLSTLTAAVHKAVERPEDNIHYILMLPTQAVTAFRNTLGNILQLPYNIYTATSMKRQPDARFHIFTYSSLRNGLLELDKKRNVIGVGENKYFDILKDLKLKYNNLWLIADEAHALQDPNSIQYKMVEAIRPLFIGMWFLTATPILNDLDGLFYMTELTHPGFFGNIWQFKHTYQVLENDFVYIYDRRARKKVKRRTVSVVDYKNLDLLEEKFNDIAIIRSISYNLEFKYLSTKLSEASEKFYQLASEGIITKEKGVKDYGARLHDLQQVVSNSHPTLKLFSEDEVSEKELLLIKTIEEVLSNGEATLVYFTYRDTLERIKTLLQKLRESFGIGNVYEIHGGISVKARAKIEKSIKPNDVVLITSAGTESVNLQRANNLIFYEIPFPLREFIQACGRIARMDSKFDKFIVYILEAEGTIDTYKKNRIIANSGAIKGVMGKSNSLPTQLLHLSLEDVKASKDELLWRK